MDNLNNIKVQQGQVSNSVCDANSLPSIKLDLSYTGAVNYKAFEIQQVECYGRCSRPLDNAVCITLNNNTHQQPLTIGYLSPTPNSAIINKGEVIDGGSLFKTYYSNDGVYFLRTDKSDFKATAMNGEKTNEALLALFNQFTGTNITDLVFWINNTLIKALQAAGIAIPEFQVDPKVTTNETTIKDNKNLITKNATNEL